MVAFGSTLYADFAGYGLYSWNGTTWTYINSVIRHCMAASNSTFYADFRVCPLFIQWHDVPFD